MARPGLMIPVFFLLLPKAVCQEQGISVRSRALAGCNATLTCLESGTANQAGLAWDKGTSLVLYHTRPFCIGDLGISSLGARVPAGGGTFGITLSDMGISGMHLFSSWIGYGLRIGKDLSAGMGLHLRDYATREYGHKAGIGCALGFQYKPTKKLLVAGHVRHPCSYIQGIGSGSGLPTTLTTGFAYTFFRTGTVHSELQASTEGPVAFVQGLEAFLTPAVTLSIGWKTRPLTVSGGTGFTFDRWHLSTAVSWCFDTGTTPAFAIAYAWNRKD